jgi:hypothetical protein
MAEKSKYAKAYTADQFRAYPKWSEKIAPASVTVETDETSTFETVEYFFLHDSYVVTCGVFRDEEVAFDSVTDEWKEFCHAELNFDPTGEEAVQQTATVTAQN